MKIHEIPTSTLNEQELNEVREKLSLSFDRLAVFANEADALVRKACHDGRDLIGCYMNDEKARKGIEELNRLESKIDNPEMQSKLEMIERKLKDGIIEETVLDQAVLYNMITERLKVLLEIDSNVKIFKKEFVLLFETGNHEIAIAKQRNAEEIVQLLEVQRKNDEEIFQLTSNLSP
jgi:hypothetical protein